MTLRLRLLGPVDASLDGMPLPTDLQWRKHLALLIYLACDGGRGRSRDHLGELLWPEGNAARSLSQALVPIRRVLGEDAVRSHGGLVRLAAGAVAVDLDELDQLVDQRRWSDAAALVGGEFCKGFAIRGASAFEDWLTTQRMHWRETGLRAILGHGEEQLAAGDLRGALASSKRAIELDPISEPAMRLHLRVLTLGDQRNTALAEYERFVIRLREALGTEPDEETRAIVSRLRSIHFRGHGEAGAPSGASRRTPLIGRVAALTTLLDAWGQCRRRRCATLLVIAGDPGTGKSRLAAELVARSRLDGAAVTEVRLVGADAAAAESVLLGLARGGLLEARGIPAAHPAALARLGRSVADWADRFPARLDSSLALGQALGEVLHAALEEQPVVLLVDDAQWSDPESLQFLEAILRDLAMLPVLLLLTIETHPGRDEIDRLRSRIGRETTGATVQLGPLGLAEIADLARWALPPQLTGEQFDRVARRVLADSAGLPLLAVELLHAVALGLDLADEGGAWPVPFHTLTDTLPGGLPDSIIAAIRVGFRRLSPEAQLVLIAIAVLGEKVDARLLARATELAAPARDAALDELEWQRWLQVDARGYGFVARIARDVVDRDMVTQRQRAQIVGRARET